MQLDPSIFLHSEYDSGYENMSIPISYSFLFQSYDDDSFNKTLEIISNFLSYFDQSLPESSFNWNK